MKLPLISRKKYENLRNNYKIMNEERMKLSIKNRDLQEENKKLKEQFKLLKKGE